MTTNTRHARPVATVCFEDPEFMPDSVTFSRQDWRRLKALPPGTALYTATDYEAMCIEVDRLRQGIWDARAIMGFDNDGNPTPRALVSDIVQLLLGDARSMREDYDAALSEEKANGGG